MKTITKNLLHEAIKMRLPLSSIQKVLTDGADINGLNVDGYSPLIEAIDAQMDEVALYLVDQGADVFFKHTSGTDALYFAVYHGSLEVYDRLVEAGADPTIPSGDWPLLNVLCSRAHKFKGRRMRVFKRINGIETLVTDPNEVAKVAGADRYANFQEIGKKLLAKGADVNAPGGDANQSPLLLCASHGDLELATWLLDKGAEVNTKDNFGLSPLHWASRKGHRKVVKLLLERGANPNAQESYGFTPLHEAAENNWGQIVGMLLEAGANKELGLTRSFPPYGVGDTALDIAKRKPCIHIIPLLS